MTGQEILEYFQNTARTHHLDKYVKLQKKVIGAKWNEERGEWLLTVEDVATGRFIEDNAHFLINGSGFLK